MYKILSRQDLTPQVIRMDILAPRVAKKSNPGQFIMLRVDEHGERIPLTIADYDAEKGSVTIIFQVLGKTTQLLAEKNAGDELMDFVGPLGQPSHLGGYKRAAVIGGGLGCAIAYPQAKALNALGAKVDVIAGFRGQDFVILEDDMRAVSENFYLMSDDGTAGEKGLVTHKLKALLDGGEKYDLVVAIGPLIMMKFVCALTREYGIKTLVSMNPVMVDGTGMCGACRITVAGKTRFACVEGPDFDGHEVDFDEAIRRSQTYKPQERAALEDHLCRMEASADAQSQHAAE